MKEALQQVFNKHKDRLDTIKENRAREIDNMKDSEMKILDEYVRGLAEILSDINYILTSKTTPND